MRKAPNPLARGHRSRYADEMQALRCVLGREYADLLLGCRDGPRYHHMMTGKRTATQSQGEKDLRIYEALISVAHRIVWIALQRKHYTLIGMTKSIQCVLNLTNILLYNDIQETLYYEQKSYIS